MLILIIVAIVLFLLWTGICYLFVYYSSYIISKVLKSSLHQNKTFVFITTIILAVSATLFVVFRSPAKNYDQAFIEKVDKEYKVTVKGKRILMSHDPVSAFLQRTYEDSISFLVPTNEGKIYSDKIKVLNDLYRPTGTITITGQKMTINLFYEHTEKTPDSWNGSYELRYR